MKIRNFIKDVRRWWVNRDCYKCARLLIMMGQENGAAQEHINAAKDALFRAIRLLEK